MGIPAGRGRGRGRGRGVGRFNLDNRPTKFVLADLPATQLAMCQQHYQVVILI